jgi:hypothetical protein
MIVHRAQSREADDPALAGQVRFRQGYGAMSSAAVGLLAVDRPCRMTNGLGASG